MTRIDRRKDMCIIRPPLSTRIDVVKMLPQLAYLY